MEDLMLGIATNCLTAAMILWKQQTCSGSGDAGNYRSGSVSDLCAEMVKKNDAEL